MGKYFLGLIVVSILFVALIYGYDSDHKTVISGGYIDSEEALNQESDLIMELDKKYEAEIQALKANK